MTEHYEQPPQAHGSEKSIYETARNNASQACNAEVCRLRDSQQSKSTARSEFKGDFLTIPPLYESAGEQQKNTHLIAERARLDTLVGKTTLDSRESAQFKGDMQTFEKRAKEQGLNAEAVAKTYSQVSRILEAKGNQPLSEKERVRAAMDIMAIAAEPTLNPQGGHNTCNVTTLENRLFSRQPDVAAGLIADVATTGQYVAKDKERTTVRLDPESLKIQPEELDAGNNPEKNRNYASQLFQVTAINLLYERDNKKFGTDQHYIQGPEIQTATEYKTGEKVVDGSKEFTSPFGDGNGGHQQKGGSVQELVDINTMITGQNQSQAFLERKDMADPRELQAGKDMTAPRKPRGSQMSSEEEFKKQLDELNKSGQFPAVVAVNIANEPFYSIMEDSLKKEISQHPDPDHQKQGPETLVDTSTLKHDGHFVLITGYNPKTQEVTYKNPNGGDLNPKEPVKVDDFYKAMASAKASVWLDRLEKARDQALAQGKFKEDVHARNLAEIMSEYTLRWTVHEKGQVDPGNRERATHQYERALQRMSPANAEMTRYLVREEIKRAMDSRSQHD